MRKRLKKMHWRVFYISLSLGVILVSFLISTAQYEIRYVDNDISTEIKEIRYKYVHLRRYKSTQDSTIELWALIYLPAKPSPILVTSHGWHGTLFLTNRWEKP